MYPINNSSFTGVYPPIGHKEIVHTWIGDTYTVRLLKEENKLLYQVLDTTNKVNYSNQLEIPPPKSIDQMIKIMKLCQVYMGANGVPNFLHNYRTWNLKNKKIHLLRDSETLLWNIFHQRTGTNLFPPIKTATISSSQCHPETVALIEKIKEESLSPIHINYLREDFEVTRVLSSEEVHREIIQMGDNKLNILKARDNQKDSSEQKKLGAAIGVGSGALYLAWNTITTMAGAVGPWLGGGALGTVVTNSVGVGLGALSFRIGMMLPKLVITSYTKSLYAKKTEKVKDLAKRVDTLAIERPIFVEIEPKSIPSEIDDRMRVSKFTWAVALVTYKGVFGNHAEIIVEGINDGFYNSHSSRSNNSYSPTIGEKFTYLAHFNPPVESKLLESNNIRFDTRTEIWMRPNKQVQKMLESIRQEEQLPLKGQTYNIAGIDSILFNKVGHNCFTWARDKLEMLDVDLGKSIVGFVLTLPKTYTKSPEAYQEQPTTLI